MCLKIRDGIFKYTKPQVKYIICKPWIFSSGRGELELPHLINHISDVSFIILAYEMDAFGIQKLIAQIQDLF
jgi:hypothetical protein